jgi:predicted nucleotidyltransferase
MAPSESNLPSVLKTRREDVLRIAARHGARNVRVFGSVARGEADEASDIDILVDMEIGRSLLDLAGLLIDLEATLNCKVDVVTERGLRRRIRDRVLAEAIPL